MKKGGFSRISSSPLQKGYPYEATRLSGGACDTPRLPLSNVRPDARRLVQNFRVAFCPVWSSIWDSLLKLANKCKIVTFEEVQDRCY